MQAQLSQMDIAEGPDQVHMVFELKNVPMNSAARLIDCIEEMGDVADAVQPPARRHRH
jgi:hypothetical protein